ncbi:MAG: hypothetical protein AAFR87_05315 [Bacteroidota bacterium]
MAVTPKTIENQVIAVDESLRSQFESQYQIKFPYGSVLSFKKLIEHWKKLLDSENLNEVILAKEVMMRLEKVPELIGDIDDPALLEKHKELVDLMISGLFPSLRKEDYMGIVAYPFGYNYVHKSKAVEKVMQMKFTQANFGESMEEMQRQKIVNAGICILNEHYGQNIENDMVMTFSITDEETGLVTYYKGKVDTTYTEVRAKAPLKKLNASVIRKLTNNIDDTDLWLKNLPPENFEFVGMVQVKMTDISEEQAFNNLKLSLLQQNAVVDLDKVKNIEFQMRNYLKSPHLKLGIAGKGYGPGDEFGIKSGLWNSLLPMKEEYFQTATEKALYRRVMDEGQIAVIDDLTKISNPTLYVQDLIKIGIKGLVIAPMLDESRNPIGVLELGSPTNCGFHAIKTARVKEILPVFKVALQRAIEEKGNKVDVLIKQKYTSIHPSVEWRFIQAANELINRRQLNPDHDTPEPISFKDVYPLYGQSDIVGSSGKRNKAIQQDLIENLELLKRTLGPIEMCKGFPLIGVYQYRTQKFIDSLKKNVNSGDEVRVTEFLTEEIQPLLDNLSKQSPEFAKICEGYKEQLDPEMRVIYTHRRAYENSVTFINQTLSRLINNYQEDAQRILPHYFEMYKTDGVEYNLYMGESLLYGQEFDEKYIENIRLWQLMTMIAVTRKVNEIQDQLELPLKTAELILAFSNKIAIRFKTEEKQFDVDGAYNVRYEVIKKRIDKSKIKGTNERLTQAGKIAIVFTQEKERLEYLQFFEYLKSQAMIEDEVEELLIDELQGVSGLRALRVKVIV